MGTLGRNKEDDLHEDLKSRSSLFQVCLAGGAQIPNEDTKPSNPGINLCITKCTDNSCILCMNNFMYMYIHIVYVLLEHKCFQ